MIKPKYAGNIWSLYNSSFFFFGVLLLLFPLLSFLNGHGYVKYSILTAFLILGLFLTYFIFRSNFKNESCLYFSQRKYRYSLLIIFFVSYFFSIFYLSIIDSLYTKSLPYYFFIGICSSSLFLFTFLNSNQHFYLLNLSLGFLLSLNIVLSNFITFPNGTYASGDTHYQIYDIMLPIIKNGMLPSNYSYSFFPIHQILVAITSIITNFDPVKLYLRVNSVIYAFTGLIVYSLSRRIFDWKIGIVSMLFFITAPEIIYHANHAYQFSYAFPFSIFTLFVVLLSVPNIHKENPILQVTSNKISFVILLLIFVFAIIWTHQFTSAVEFFLLIFLFLILHFVFKDAKNKSFYKNTFLLFFSILFFHWIYVSYGFSQFSNIVNVYFNSLFRPENYQAALDISYSGYVSNSSNISTSTTISRPPFLIDFYNTFGIAILFMLSTLGFFYGLFIKKISIFWMISCGTFVWCLVSIGSFIKMPLLLSVRLLTFFWGWSVVYIASLGIMFIVVRYRKKGVFLCSILIFLITFFNLSCFVSGPETSLFVGNQPYNKMYDTERDIISNSWIQKSVPEKSCVNVAIPFAHRFLDKKRVYEKIPLNGSNLDLTQVQEGNYLLLTSLISCGLPTISQEVVQMNSIKSREMTTIEAQKLRGSIMKFNYSDLKDSILSFNEVYTNGESDIFLNS